MGDSNKEIKYNNLIKMRELLNNKKDKEGVSGINKMNSKSHSQVVGKNLTKIPHRSFG